MNMPSAEFSHANSGSPADMMGADILVNALAAEGVEFVWGYPGGAVLYIYDAFYKQNKIEHILVRHEQAAVHAADGYARATGKVGVALVTSGPGVTNAVTLESDLVGPVTIVGAGAGKEATGMALLSDLVAIQRVG